MMRTRLMQGVLGFTALTLLVGSFKVMQSKPEPPPPTTVAVSRGVVLASVNATGNVTVSDQLALDFPVGGLLEEIYVKEGERVVAGQPLGRIDDLPARAKVEQAQADVRAAQERVDALLEGATRQEQEQNNANIDAARTSVTKAVDTVRRAEETLRTGTATRQNAVDDARRNLDNARSAAAQHAKDLQLDIDQIAERLGEHEDKLARDQAKYDFDSQQAESARAAEIETLRRIDTQRAVLAEIEDRMREKNCNAAGTPSGGSGGGQTTSTTSGVNTRAASTKAGSTKVAAAGPLTFQAADKKGSGKTNREKECERLAEDHAQVELDLAHDQDQLQVIRQDRNRYEGYVRDDSEQIISDQQTVDQDERDLADAKNALKAGAIDDEKRINDAELQLTTALDDQKKGDLADQQAVSAARNDVDAAEAQVNQQAAAKAVQEQPESINDVAAAQADVSAKQAVLEDFQRQLDDTTLLAPTDGTVAVINGRIGEEIAGGGSNRGGFDASAASRPPNAQAPGSVSSRAGGFVTLTDLGTNEVKARFSEADTAKIKAGQAAKVEFESLGQQLSARVVRIDPIETVVANVVTYTVTLLLDKKLDEIKPGMTGNVDVIISQKQNVLRLPVTAINPRNGRATVQVLGKDGNLETRQVSTGLKGDDDVEITSGLDVGDKVVVAAAGAGAGRQAQGG